MDLHGGGLPNDAHQEFEASLKYSRLQHGVPRVQCAKCYFERLPAFFYKKRGLCLTFGPCRMVETALPVSDEVVPNVPLRPWVNRNIMLDTANSTLR